MKLTKFFLKFLLLGLVSVGSIAHASTLYSWERHIYNNTDDLWGFHIKSISGEFYANCESNCTHGTDIYANTDFIVYGGEIWKIKMVNPQAYYETQVGIINQNGDEGVYCFFNPSLIEIYADHRGNTGSVLLNSPADADVQLNNSNASPRGSNPC